MADNSITTLEERKGVYDSAASELNARVENIKRYLNEIKELKQKAEETKRIVDALEEKLKALEAENDPTKKDEVEACKISLGLKISSHSQI